MSYRIGSQLEKHTDYRDSDQLIDFSQYSDDDIRELFREILENKIHGICFSLYAEGQQPGDIISEDQVRRRMEILHPYVSCIRTFSCTDGNELIPRVAKEMGIKTLVGAWLGNDHEANNREVIGLIQLAQEGFVDIAAVGNEVIYRQDLSEDELLGFIYKVKEEIPDIPVGYVDAYYEFTIKPRITDASDIILTNCYPFWEGTPFDYAVGHMQEMYKQTKEAAQGKKVIITETGWPSQGENEKASFPSTLNAIKYFIQTHLWTKEENIETYYFSSFDESWKLGDEGTVGAYWGLWDKYEQLKY